MPIISNSPTLKAPAQLSAKMFHAVGSGSRPTPSVHKIATSAPEQPYKLDGRGDVPGALGEGGGMKMGRR